MANKKEFKTKTPAMTFASRRLNDGYNVLISVKDGLWRMDRRYIVEWYKR